jgi:peptide/nickel transport system substrate-binding protein
VTERRDRVIVGALSLALVVLAGLVALPTPVPVEATPGPSPTDSPATSPATYREGVVGHPTSVTPLTARTRADRELVGLIFSGLVRLGPGTSILPDLAASWEVDPSGTVWTFHLRADARWHDDQPVTAADIVFTVDALKSPEVASPVAASWADVTAEAVDARTVRFTLESALGGFLEAATQPILPQHLLADVRLADLDTDAFGREPIGSGPYRLILLQDDRALLEAAGGTGGLGAATSSALPRGSVATPPGSGDPQGAPASIPRIELHFYDDAAALADAYRQGDLEAASGLPPATAGPLATETDARLIRYPTTTLAAVLLDLRPSDPELRPAAVRRALLAALDRDALITGPLGGAGLRAEALVPPASWAYDGDSAGHVAFDPRAAASSLTAAEWTRVGGAWRAPKSTSAYAIEVLAPTADAEPAVNALAQSVVAAWRSLGLDAGLVAVDPPELATRLRQGRFTAAVVDIGFNLDPDLYPLLASTQATSRGTNLSGLQDTKLDPLLVAARKPGTMAQRTGAYEKLLAYLATTQPILPLAWRDEILVVKGVDGPAPRLIVGPGDRYHDVLTWRLASGG